MRAKILQIGSSLLGVVGLVLLVISIQLCSSLVRADEPLTNSCSPCGVDNEGAKGCYDGMIGCGGLCEDCCYCLLGNGENGDYGLGCRYNGNLYDCD